MAERLYVVDNGGDELWLVNPADSDDETGDYGLVGTLPSGLTAPQGVAVKANGDLYVVDSVGDDLWLVNPADSDDETGDYGLVGTLPSGLTAPQGVAVKANGDLYVVDNVGDELWLVNPADPDDETGDYGLVGTLPSGLTVPTGVAVKANGDLYVVDNVAIFGDELWLVNPADPDDETGDYGLVGTLPSGLTVPTGVAVKANGDLYVVDSFGDELWLVNPADPDDETGDYGLVGTLPSGLTVPTGVIALTFVEDIGAVTFSLTVSFSVTDIEVQQPTVEVGSVEFPLTLAWSVSTIEVDQPLALDDFDQEGETLILALITANDDELDLYDSPNSLGSASADSDLNITDDLLITRMRRITSNTRLAIFRSGTDNFDDLFGTGGTYENATFYIQTADRVISLPPAQVLDISESRLRFNIPSADQSAFAGIGGSDLFIFAVTTPGAVEVGAVDFPLTLSWSVSSIEVEDNSIGAVEFPLTVAWSVDSIVAVNDQEIGAVTFPVTLSWSVTDIEVVTVPTVTIEAVEFPFTLSWSVASIEVQEYNVGAVEFPLTLSWSADSIEVEEYNIGAATYSLTLSWSVESIEVTQPTVDIGAVTFPLTLEWSVGAIEVDQPDVEVGAVTFPLTLAWSVGSIAALNPQEIGAVTYAMTVSWSVDSIEAFTEAVVVVSDALGRRGQVYPSNSAPMSHYRRGQSLPNNITV